MLTRISPVEARPVNSSMVFGGCPAASTRTGDSINSAIAFQPTRRYVGESVRSGSRFRLRLREQQGRAPTHRPFRMAV
jgi:hypothetical protein